MAMKADWSELPNNLLNPISQRIDTEINLIRFRSICSSWRSSSIPNHHCNILTIKFSLNIDSIIKNNITEFRNLSKHSFFLIKPPQLRSPRRPWLLKMTQNSTGKTKFHHPLLRYGLSFSFHLVFFDFNKLSLLHLATNFICGYRLMKPLFLFSSCLPTKAIAVTSHGYKPIILATFACSGDQPVVLKFGDENWKVIPEMSSYLGDICVCKGRPYVVDKTGRTITVGLGPDDSTVQLVARSLVGGGDIKFLVESDGDLLLADIFDRRLGDERVRIDVFKLNAKEKMWVKLANLGDIVLFLGSLCSFSASVTDLCVLKGNCVIIMDNIFNCGYCTLSFLDLDDGRLLPSTDYDEYINLFLTPEKWIKKMN